MSSVTVEFQGICTHFNHTHLSSSPRVRHRVVLVRSERGVHVREVHIPEHVAHLQLSPDGRRHHLRGVTLRLEPASPKASLPPFDVAPSFALVVPQLASLVAPIAPLSEPSPAVVLDHLSAEAACYFDIEFGTLHGAIDDNDAVYTTLVVQSSDTDIVLKATPFGDGALPEGLSETTTLPDGAVISVANVDSNPDDKKPVDFLLHYRTAARMPPIPQLPQVPSGPAPRSAATPLPRRMPAYNFGAIGAGCSNSSYP